MKAIIRDIRDLPINPPNVNLPTWRALLVLSYLLVNIVKVDQDQVILKDQLIEKAIKKRNEQE